MVKQAVSCPDLLQNFRNWAVHSCTHISVVVSIFEGAVEGCKVLILIDLLPVLKTI